LLEPTHPGADRSRAWNSTFPFSVYAKAEFVDENTPPDPDRWGVWNVGFPYPMQTRQDAKRNLEAILPLLKQQWERWRPRT
jgi:hypothetical protein